jgi:hypothetical protein
MAAPGLYAALANAMLDRIEAAGYVYLQLHVGEPGLAGTSNIAVESARILVDWAAASGGVIQLAADITVDDVGAVEDWTHWTLWTASTGGTVGLAGLVVANAVGVGDDVVIAAESVSVTFPLYSV